LDKLRLRMFVFYTVAMEHVQTKLFDKHSVSPQHRLPDHSLPVR
jgi:hypothetical protein